MAQYQRFLSYLFEYEGDQKKENCGFAKIEIRGEVQQYFLSVKIMSRLKFYMYLAFIIQRMAAIVCRLAVWL